MTSILVAYGSGEGQTAKVARFIEDVLTYRGHDVTLRNVTDGTNVAPDDFDVVLVGSPVHNRKHLPSVVEFVHQNRDALGARPNGFFQLSLAATIPFGWAEGGDEEFVNGLVGETGWQPDRVGLFAGAVKYSQYTPVERVLFKTVSAITTGDTDTTQDYEYTDWDDVESFANEFADYVESELPADGRMSLRGTGGRLTRAVVGAAVLVGVAGVVYWAAARRLTPPEC